MLTRINRAEIRKNVSDMRVNFRRDSEIHVFLSFASPPGDESDPENWNLIQQVAGNSILLNTHGPTNAKISLTLNSYCML